MTKSNMSRSAELNEIQQLREENARLRALLTKHSIAWEEEIPVKVITKTVKSETVDSQLPPSEKITLFRRLFRGRTDAYPVRWQSTQGRSGYSPACGNEWKAGVCNKKKVKCADCPNRLLLPVTDQVIFDHLAGKKTVGVYPLLDDNGCYFLATDFDKGEWREDASAFFQSCRDLDIPAALEISRSGNGAHVWILISGWKG
ncbi:MAG TPA: hypothetical protein ENK89_03100 [Desulfobulbaceae bacterium]|nr:hypothetical protein [Desulfobulbaceae bacterium]